MNLNFSLIDYKIMFSDLNVNTLKGLEEIKFPDGQIQLKLRPDLNLKEGSDVRVFCRIRNNNDLMKLIFVSNCLDNSFLNKKDLYIPYLIGARYDRIMQEGDCFTLKTVAELINNLNFKKVHVYDVHSDVSLALINNVIHHNNKTLLSVYEQTDSVLICPDSGASKKVKSILEVIGSQVKDVIYCSKQRDLKTGNLELVVLEPEKCKNQNCLIVDDICDGGGTFLAIASQIKPKHLALVVTHGIFSKGIKVLETKFDQVITTNSFNQDLKSENNLIVIDCEEDLFLNFKKIV